MCFEIGNLLANKLIVPFCEDETGAVTVDWIVLTAAIVGISLGLMNTISTGVVVAGDEIVCTLENMQAVRNGEEFLCNNGTIAPPPSPPNPSIPA